MDFKALAKKVREIKTSYEDYAKEHKKKIWSTNDYIRGLVGDVGDLVKRITVYEDDRTDADVKNEVRHELADCLWSLMIIAQELEIDLEKEFLVNVEYIEQKLREATEL